MSVGNEIEKGVLLIAFGKPRYVNFAKNLSSSIRLYNSEIPIALVTDSEDTRLADYFQYIIPLDPEKGSGFSQKMYMNKYSPFQKTLFIDSDCLAVGDISFLFEWMNGQPISVLGKKVFHGSLLGTTIEEIKKKININYLPTFNGGVYYFEKGEESEKVFNLARVIFFEKYKEWGLWLFDGKPGDEPAMSIAMGHFQIEPTADPEYKSMYTPVGQKGIFKMDILKGFCLFNKNDVWVRPTVMHFGGGYPEAFHYKREIAKLNFYSFTKISKPISSFFINLIYNTPYIIFVFLYRLIKWVSGKSKLKFSPLIPMFRFE